MAGELGDPRALGATGAIAHPDRGRGRRRRGGARAGVERGGRRGSTACATPSSPTTSSALWYLGWAEIYLERFDAGLAHLRRGIAISRATGRGDLIVPMMLGQARGLLALGRTQEAADVADEAIEVARGSGNPQYVVWALWERGWVALVTGDHNAAQILAEEAMDLARELSPTLLSPAEPGWTLALALIDGGEHERGRAVLLDAIGGPEAPRVVPTERTAVWEELVGRRAAPRRASTRRPSGRRARLAARGRARARRAGRAGARADAAARLARGRRRGRARRPRARRSRPPSRSGRAATPRTRSCSPAARWPRRGRRRPRRASWPPRRPRSTRPARVACARRPRRSCAGSGTAWHAARARRGAPRGAGPGAAHRARARDRRARHRAPHQPPDRRRAVPVGEDGRDPPAQHLRQARRRLPRRGRARGRARRAARPGRRPRRRAGRGSARRSARARAAGTRA